MRPTAFRPVRVARFGLFLFALYAAGSLNSPARADTIQTFDATGTFQSGTTLSGTISIDETPPNGLLPYISAADLSTSGQNSYEFNNVVFSGSDGVGGTLLGVSTQNNNARVSFDIPYSSLALGSYSGSSISTNRLSYLFSSSTSSYGTTDLLVSGNIGSAVQSPIFAVTATLGGPLSTSGVATSILVTATPINSPTVQQAATALGYQSGLDWVQTISVPSPSPYAANANPSVHLTGTFNDPPTSGYTYDPAGTAGRYPFYYNAQTIQNTGYCLTTTGGGCLSIPAQDSNSLSLFDAPADPCLPGGSGYMCGGMTAASGSLEFTDELVGIVSCDTPNIGACNSAGLGPSAPIPFIYNGAVVTDVDWTDTFNGLSGGIPVLSSLGPVDAGSGSGGITLQSTSVPEPSTLLLLALFLGAVLIMQYCTASGKRLK